MAATFLLIELVMRDRVAKQIEQFVLIEQLQSTAGELDGDLTRDVMNIGLGAPPASCDW